MKIRGFEICKGYEDKGINLPIRQTKHAVGYDIEAAEDTVIPSMFEAIKNGENIKPTLVKTGVKAYFQPDEVMYIYNRSGGPSKKGLVVANSVGVIDCDYYSNPSNDGELMVAFYNFAQQEVSIQKGERIAQLVFQKFLITDNDSAEGDRLGGFGSTKA